jgi:Tfp pilus assembly protein PilV
VTIQNKLTPELVQHEHSRIMDDYIDAKAVIKAKRDKKLDALRARCPHEDIDKDRPGPSWCCHCESEVEVIGRG